LDTWQFFQETRKIIQEKIVKIAKPLIVETKIK